MALVPDKATRDAEAQKRRAAQLLMTAYLQSKALAELLVVINRPQSETGFSLMEQTSVSLAHQHVVQAHAMLDNVICDRGNRLGEAYTRELIEGAGNGTVV